LLRTECIKQYKIFTSQLEEHILRLREELDREREERNYFQLERDKVNTFWEITKRQLEEKKAELRNKDREMEDAEERHQIEIKVCAEITLKWFSFVKHKFILWILKSHLFNNFLLTLTSVSNGKKNVWYFMLTNSISIL